MNDDANFDPPPTQAMLLLRQTQRFKPSDTPRTLDATILYTRTVQRSGRYIAVPSVAARERGFWNSSLLARAEAPRAEDRPFEM